MPQDEVLICRSCKAAAQVEFVDGEMTKPIPRWDVHFGEIDDDRKDSKAPHITFSPLLGGHR